MRFLLILGALTLAACGSTTPTGPTERPSFSPSGNLKPVCHPGTHKRITAVSFFPPPAHVIAWVCVPD